MTTTSSNWQRWIAKYGRRNWIHEVLAALRQCAVDRPIAGGVNCRGQDFLALSYDSTLTRRPPGRLKIAPWISAWTEQLKVCITDNQNWIRALSIDYTVNQKNMPLLSISSPIIDQFSKFFHWHTFSDTITWLLNIPILRHCSYLVSGHSLPVLLLCCTDVLNVSLLT